MRLRDRLGTAARAWLGVQLLKLSARVMRVPLDPAFHSPVEDSDPLSPEAEEDSFLPMPVPVMTMSDEARRMVQEGMRAHAPVPAAAEPNAPLRGSAAARIAGAR